MKVDGKDIRPIWLDEDLKTVKIIDQRLLPHEFVICDVKIVDGIIAAIQSMQVRGAPLIGVTAAYGMYLAVLNHPGETVEDDYIVGECERIKSARPTAVNLAWAADRVLGEVLAVNNTQERIEAARNEADKITEEEVDNCKKIGEHGVELIQAISKQKKGRTVNILTHCNAGWLACIEWGTATAPIYAAFDKNIDIHVWVGETRPLNQGARLTAWELGKYGVNHTVIIDNASGYLMQQGMVDMVIVGSDRTTFTGDVANKIGTYHKALAARDNDVPFYAALPSSTIDWEIKDGIKEIPIEQRDPDEIRYIQGLNERNVTSVLVPPADSPAANFAFDVTPARLVTGIITERGVCRASAVDVKKLFPDKSF
ncbi:MAG: S-methyl-5-thioribose-1-phosphate isomerase [Deltaproteobacteria bacterium]|nr:S-methyl-5-thioribose-1-phosphate isomerase [Deltaproteobacteria bacterium]